jgi:hypothetical protein
MRAKETIMFANTAIFLSNGGIWHAIKKVNRKSDERKDDKE